MKILVACLLFCSLPATAHQFESYRTQDALFLRKDAEAIHISICADGEACTEMPPVLLTHWKPFMQKVAEETESLLNLQLEGAAAGILAGATAGAVTYRLSRASYDRTLTRRKLLTGLGCLGLFGATTTGFVAGYEWLVVPLNGPRLMQTISAEMIEAKRGETRMYQLLEDDAVVWRFVALSHQHGGFLRNLTK